MFRAALSSRPLAAIAAVFLQTGYQQEIGKCRTSPNAKPGPHDRYDSYRGMAAQVFISRPIHTDPAADNFASKLRDKLEGKDIIVFPSKAPSGSRLAEYFERGASTSQVFVAVLTPQYFNRFWTMRELDLALAAHDDSREQIKLIPIVTKPGGLRHDDFRNQNWEVEWRKLAQEELTGPKVDVDRWKKNFERLHTLTIEAVNSGEEEEDFLKRCSESIVQAMQPDPYDCRYDVFIAHTGIQKDFAVQLQDTLGQLGFDAFVDKRDLAQGAGDADDHIQKALQTAHVGVVVLSDAFLDKKYPMQELEAICERDNLMPILYDITYEDMEKRVRDNKLLQREDFKRRVLRTTAHLNMEDKPGFRSILCQRVAFAVLCAAVTKCEIRRINSQAAFTFVKRVHTMLEKVVKEPHCLPDITKRDVKYAKDLLKTTRAILEHPRLSIMFGP